MKKVIALLLVLCMVTGMLSMTVVAESEPVLNVKGYNITLKDSVYLKYAVQAINANDVKMLLWNGSQNSYELGTQDKILESTGSETVSGVECLIFVDNDLAMKQMTDVIYARPMATVNGNTYYGEIVKYSVLQYAYNMLGKTGTASNNAAFRSLLESMLVFGANAQRYLDYHTERLADSAFFKVSVVGGVLPDGFTGGLYQTGNSVQITAPAINAESIAFNHWETSSGVNMGSSAVQNITVGTANETYIAVYGEDKPEGPVFSEGLKIEIDGDEAVVVGMGTCTDEFVRIPPEVDGVSVVAINSNAFDGNKTMTSVFIPSSVIEIGAKAFYNCSNLTDVYYEGTEEEFDEISIGRNNNPLNNAEIHFESSGPEKKDEPVFTEPTIYVNSTSAKPGENVEVNISLANIPAFFASNIEVSYDQSILTLVGHKYGDSYLSGSDEPNYDNNPVTLNWSNPILSDVANDGVYVTLIFKVSEDAISGAKADVSVSCFLSTTNEENPEVNEVNGTVTIP